MSIVTDCTPLDSIRDQLEGMVDRVSLSTVLSLLGTICQAKAEHVAENWQDDRMAKTWDKASRRLDALSIHHDILGAGR